MPHALHARIIISGRVGEIDTVASLQFASFHRFAFFHLYSRCGAEQFFRTFIKRVLRKRRTIEGVCREIFIEISFAVVQAHRAEDVRRADQRVPRFQYGFYSGVFAFFQAEFLCVCGGYVQLFSAIINAIPAVEFGKYGVRFVFLRRSRRFVSAARARAKIYAVARTDDIQPFRFFLRFVVFRFVFCSAVVCIVACRWFVGRIVGLVGAGRSIGRGICIRSRRVVCIVAARRDFGRFFPDIVFRCGRGNQRATDTIARRKRLSGKNRHNGGKNQSRRVFRFFHSCCLPKSF